MSIAKQFEETLSRSGRGLSHQMDRTGLAMAVVTCGPSLLVYPFVQKYFVKGVTIGSVKG